MDSGAGVLSTLPFRASPVNGRTFDGRKDSADWFLAETRIDELGV
jgi:hypothetical protein